MSRAADRDEQAELTALREAAARSAADAGDTAAALVGKLGEARHPNQWLRTGVVKVRQRAVHATHDARQRPVLIGVPVAVLFVGAALLVLRRRLRDLSR